MQKEQELTKRMRAHQTYRNENDEIVPSATTVLGILNKPALVKWANNLGLQGIDSSKYVDKMAGIGTLAHSLIECHLMGSKPEMAEYSPDDVAKAKIAFAKYLEWEKEQEIEPLLIEKQLVSEKLGFGGQIDYFARLNGKNTLIDFKTCKAIYPEMMCQLATYKNLLDENGYEVEDAMILRVGRDENEGFEIKKAGELADEWSIFSHCLAIYKLKKKLNI
jgi:hypothetical protein